MCRCRPSVVAQLCTWAFVSTSLGGGPALAKPPKPDLTREQFETILADSLGEPPTGGGELVVIPVKGSFDYFPNPESPVVHPAIFDSMIHVATARDPAAIILDIDSPGGYVWIMNSVIDRLLESQQGRGVRVVAWPRAALSAAALATMSCKEIVVRPTCILGAATTLVGEDEPPEDQTALDRKFASVDDARRRMIAALTDRSILLQDAMQQPEARLWHHDQYGFTDEAPDSDGWRVLDDRDDRPMTLHAEELVTCGIANAMAADEAALLRALDLSGDTAVVALNPWSDTVRTKLKPINDAWNEYWTWARRYANRFLDEVFETLDRIEVTRRAAGIIANRERGYTDREHRDLARQIASCMNLPKMNLFHREAFSLFGMADCVANSLYNTRSILKRARQSMFINRETIPIGAIDNDLVEAHNLLVDMFNGCPD